MNAAARRTAALVIAAVALLAGLAVALLPADAAASTPQAAPPAVEQATPAPEAAPAAGTYTEPYTAADYAYLGALGTQGVLPAHGNGDQLIPLGHRICESVTAQVPAASVVSSLVRAGWSGTDAAYAYGTARGAYCPVR